jgi:type I restriction-modification system DNA methylase subunit
MQLLKIMANRKKDIIKIINSISGKYSAYEVFTDWIRCCALSISNSTQMFHDSVWKEREQMYLDTIRKYTKEEANKLVEMFNLLVETIESEMTDVLGEIYMESGMGSKAAGQFFTPFHLSKLCAAMNIPELDEHGKIELNEPSCGGGGMIIAMASVLKDKGINYQQCMEVVAQDLDWKGVYMCYLQLSLLGIKAVCVQGNTLMDPYVPGQTNKSHILYTPAKMGIIA